MSQLTMCLTLQDQQILDFILDNKRQGEVGGVEMWKLMEERGAVEGRSWQSLKERFRKTIVTKLRTYGLTDEQLATFTSGPKAKAKGKQKRMVAGRPAVVD